MVILGVDPGFLCAGFGVMKREAGRVQLIDYGVLKLAQRETIVRRLSQFHLFFEEKIKLHGVTHLALETPFLGKNAQNFLKLGYLRGALYLLVDRHGLVLAEFAPMQVKLALTGHGAAPKDQVARVVCALFPGLEMAHKLDMTDALAISLCGVWKS